MIERFKALRKNSGRSRFRLSTSKGSARDDIRLQPWWMLMAEETALPPSQPTKDFLDISIESEMLQTLVTSNLEVYDISGQIFTREKKMGS